MNIEEAMRIWGSTLNEEEIREWVDLINFECDEDEEDEEECEIKK
jgi:hypothetical protein